MRKKIVLPAALVAFALVALPLLAAEEASVRVFVLKWKRVEEAALFPPWPLKERCQLLLHPLTERAIMG